MMNSPVTPSAVSATVTLLYSEALSRMAFSRWSFATADTDLVTTVLMARALRIFGFGAYLAWAWASSSFAVAVAVAVAGGAAVRGGGTALVQTSRIATTSNIDAACCCRVVPSPSSEARKLSKRWNCGPMSFAFSVIGTNQRPRVVVCVAAPVRVKTRGDAGRKPEAEERRIDMKRKSQTQREAVSLRGRGVAWERG